MSIICATDFSPCSRIATRVAAGLARRKGERLVLVYVNPPEPADLAMMAAAVEGMVEEVRARLEAGLTAERKEVELPGVSVETRVLDGIPSEVLLDLSRSPETSLLVMGMYGMGRGQRLLVGSCAETVVRSSGCPVLIVPERTPNTDAWHSGRPLCLALGTDGSLATGALFYWARTDAPASPQHMTVVRIYWPPQEGNRYGIDHPWREDSGSPDLLALLERDVRRDGAALSGAGDLNVRLQVLVRSGGEELAETARALNADAVAIGIPRHRFRHWTPIDTKSLLRCAKVPVFCVPEGIRPAERRIPHYRTVLVASDLSDLAHLAILPAYGLPGRRWTGRALLRSADRGDGVHRSRRAAASAVGDPAGRAHVGHGTSGPGRGRRARHRNPRQHLGGTVDPDGDPAGRRKNRRGRDRAGLPRPQRRRPLAARVGRRRGGPAFLAAYLDHSREAG